MKYQKLYDAIAEVLVRLSSKSPKLFVYIQRATLAVTIVFGVIALAIDLNVPLPTWIKNIHAWEVVIQGGIAYIIAKLPVKDGSDLPLSK